jgi:hypothetical protein
MRRRLSLALSLAVMLLLAPTAQAVIMPVFTLSQLVERSDAVAWGRITRHECRWSEGRTRIYTYWTLEVEGAVYGAEAGQSLVVKQMGGEIGEMSMTVSGNARIQDGERVYLFLRTDGEHHYVVAMGQGKYTPIETTAGTRLLRVAPRAGKPDYPDAPLMQELSARIKALRDALPATKD